MPEIIWKGNEHTNKESRYGVVPICIVDHISTSTMYSMDSWFTDPKNDGSSAHFGVGKDGMIHQYVKIEDNAWAQGLPVAKIPLSPAPIVRDMNCNPNLYCVSIEHEGTDGELTEEQFKATVWLHRYIMQYINDKWNPGMDLGSYNVLGHYQVDPWRRPNCPGPKFPWDRLRAELAVAEKQTLEELELRLWPAETGWADRLERIQAVNNELNWYMEEVAQGEGVGYANGCMDRYMALYEFMNNQGFLPKK
ncbi:N-acetylmuramoyl-L-alanine amidase [Gorillibacterium sp. sgz5001074]|uniref:N-acetylmuramoyl-L-alanine amidase n=1 Tax=Gorillibacterium sp. sgz5001074 TaxID=3446695 RepID=UPI003F675725